MPKSFTIQYPDSLPDSLKETPEQFESEARFAMAAKLFETKRLSSGQAAALIPMSRKEFLLSLNRTGVAVIDYSDDELESEIRNAG